MKNTLRSYIKKHNSEIELMLGKVTNLEHLGEGGNGLVYSGVLNGQEVALKFLTESNNKKLERFKAEYFNINIIDNKEKIVKYIDYDQLIIGDKVLPIIIMKKYNYSLKDYRKTLEITENELMKLYDFLVKVLKNIHSQGIIHRDLKPENILIDNGNYVLSDFGIANYDSSMFGYKANTERGERLGNYNFSAPEQAYGKEQASETMDIYSLGQICQWFVFDETHKGTGRRYFSEKFGSSENIDVLDSIINKCIANSPEERYQSIEEMEKDFEKRLESKMKVDPFDEMFLLNNAIRKSEPEAYCKFKCINDNKILKQLILNINDEKFKNNSLWFTAGTENNYITRFKYEADNRILLNDKELFIKKVWLYCDDSIYNDLIILETKTNDDGIDEFEVNGEKMSHITILNGKHYIKPEIAQSGYVKINDQIVDIHEFERDYRDRFNENKFYLIGTKWSCSMQIENDATIERFQDLEADETSVSELKKALKKNKHYDVYERL